jgi:hypothetical protein
VTPTATTTPTPIPTQNCVECATNPFYAGQCIQGPLPGLEGGVEVPNALCDVDGVCKTVTPTATAIPTCGGCCQCSTTYYGGAYMPNGGACDGQCVNGNLKPGATPPACQTFTPTPRPTLNSSQCCGCSYENPNTCAQGSAAGTCPDGVVVAGTCNILVGVCDPYTPTPSATPTITQTFGPGTPTPVWVPCVGNCDNQPFTTTAECQLCQQIAVGDLPLSMCPQCDEAGDGHVTAVDVLICLMGRGGCLTMTPTITPTPTPVAVCGTTGPVTGSLGGYDGANAQCVTASGSASAHVCTNHEMLLISKFSAHPGSGAGWISAGPPGAALNTGWVADCDGFTSGSNTKYGRIWTWDGTGGKGYDTPCNQSLPLYCCCQ